MRLGERPFRLLIGFSAPMRSNHPLPFGRHGCQALSSPTNLRLDPRVRLTHPGVQGHRRLPAEDLSQPRVVAVPPADTLRLAHVVTLIEGLARDVAHEVDHPIHGDELIGPEVERLRVVGPSDALAIPSTQSSTYKNDLVWAPSPHTSICPPSGVEATLRQIAAGAFSRPPS